MIISCNFHAVEVHIASPISFVVLFWLFVICYCVGVRCVFSWSYMWSSLYSVLVLKALAHRECYTSLAHILEEKSHLYSFMRSLKACNSSENYNNTAGFAINSQKV